MTRSRDAGAAGADGLPVAQAGVLVARGARLPDVVRELRAFLTVGLGAPEGTGAALLRFRGERLGLPSGLLSRPLTAEAR
ncbi:hypothetical protein ACF1FC_32575 [Streptomyces sp. NPDC014344]|uniref:hypothetical protein n=1 Tax=Streptomyces sp. NPDC014344 TaxID=3364871 RepID=UPI0036FB8F7F